MTADRRVRVAYLSYSSGLYDARTFRMAAWAAARGFAVTIYARWEPGLPLVEEHEHYRLIRAPWTPWSLLPGGRRRELARLPRPARRTPSPSARVGRRDLRWRAAAPWRVAKRWIHLIGKYPLRPIAWSRALDDVVEPADIWHAMWAGSLPAAARFRRRHGGRTIYDSRDVYMESRNLASAPPPIRMLQGWLERRWARAADRVITVNEPYAKLLARQFGIPEPAIIMNCPAAWEAPDPRPDLLRAAAGIDAGTRVVLYQGQLISDRGIEQAMDAILQVPLAALVLLGYGDLTEHYRARAGAPPYAGRVHLLPAVHPDELVAWTASADVMVMPIQPTTVNHQYTTPQKLFESLAAGVPVVAANLPGMRAVVDEVGAGTLCDPTDPASIAAGIRTILDAPPDEQAARRERILRAARERYSWEVQVEGLRIIYDDLVASPEAAVRA